MPAAWEYEQAVNNVSNWFNTSADNVWANINQYNLTPEQVQGILPTVDSFLYGQGVNSGYTAVKAADGTVLSWNNVAGLQGNSANAVEQAVNSNAGLITQQQYQLPANTDYSGTGGTFNGAKGVTGGGSTVKVMSQVSAGVAAAGLGIKLGKAIDSALYNLNPDFWDNNGMASLNPETWNSITADMSDSGWEGNVKRAFNAIFGLDPNTGKSQMYLDADAAAYLAMYMQEQGVFDTSSGASATSYKSTIGIELTNPDIIPINADINSDFLTYPDSRNLVRGFYTSSPVYAITYYINAAQTFTQTTFVSLTPFTFDTIVGTVTNPPARPQTLSNNAVSYSIGSSTFYATTFSASSSLITSTINRYLSYVGSTQHTRDIALSLLFNSAAHISSGGVDGITNQAGATQPDFSGCETPADYKQALQQQYPDMFQNAITQNVAQPDGTVTQKVYVPVGTPTATGTQDTQPVTNPDNTGQSQSQTEVDPQAATQTIIETITKYIENLRTPDTPDTPNPPDTGDGSTPPVVVPTGSASALWSVYNPTQAQLNSFGAWLWSSNFIDQVLKLFNNPMQSIIGVHKIFAQPAISGSGNIVVGYLDSGVGSNLVGAQYTTVNCGSVSVREQFGNVFDYTDTQVRLYLPFIGIVDLDTSDVMRGTVSVVYHVDVITGACLAEVKVSRDSAGGTLYQFAGDASVRYPISSGSYMGIVAGITSAVGGVASAIATGGATLPMAAGAVAGGLSGAKTNVQHSGSFSGNAGAMGAKKPYLIIERPQTMIADGFGNYQGKGANVVRTVAQCSGYFKMSDVHTDSINGASAAEVQAIKTALENGVIK